MSALERPDLETDEDGNLRSRTFGDIYFSPEDGLAETRHVFLEGNDLHARLSDRQRRRPFVVGELGFGTGLNVLALWHAWEAGPEFPLHIWSCEGFPLSHERFGEAQRQIGMRWPELSPHAERLAACYPYPAPGQASLELAPGLTLNLAFGRVAETLQNADFRADAWFLDGFAPSRNPEMWSPEVMASIARLSAQGATAATFSVAGGVREALAAAGFSWEKAPGFGRKKHMLRARIDRPGRGAVPAPWFERPQPAPAGAVAVIGAGVAGCAVAGALEAEGRSAHIFGWDLRSGAASGNPAGLVMPRIDADDTPAARFYRDAYLFALKRYADLPPQEFLRCGGQMPFAADRAERVEAIGLWPEAVLEFGRDQVLVPDAGVLRPLRASERMAGTAKRIGHPADSFWSGEDGHWIRDKGGDTHGPFAAIVFATGAQQPFWSTAPVTPSHGQIDVFTGGPPDRITTDGSYVAPLDGDLIAGATYHPYEGGELIASVEDTAANRQEAGRLLGYRPGALKAARVALRATTPDRHPIAGGLVDEREALAAYADLAKGVKRDYLAAPYASGLYVLTGLGSRGLVTAPILAAHVAALVTGGVSPLTRPIADLVHSARFLIRQIRRGQVSP